MVHQAHADTTSLAPQVVVTMNSAPIPVLQVSETHQLQAHNDSKRKPANRHYLAPRHRREDSASSAFCSADVDVSSPTFQLILSECGLSDNCHASSTTDSPDGLMMDGLDWPPAPLSDEVLELVIGAAQSIRTRALCASFATVLPSVLASPDPPANAANKAQGLSGMLRSLSLGAIKDTVSDVLLNGTKRNSTAMAIEPSSGFLAEQHSIFSEICADGSDYYKANCRDNDIFFRDMILSMTNQIHQRTSFEPSVFVSAALYLDLIFCSCDGSIAAVFRHLCADGEVTFLDEDIAILAFLQGKLSATGEDPAAVVLPVWMQQLLAPQQQQQQQQKQRQQSRPFQQTHDIASKVLARTISLLIGKMYIVCILLAAKMQEDICYSQWQTRDYWRSVKDLIRNDEQWFPAIPTAPCTTRIPDAAQTIRKRKSLKEWAQTAWLRLSLTSPLLNAPAASTVCSSSVGWRPPITFQEMLSMEKSLFRALSFNLYISPSDFSSFVGQHTSSPETAALLVRLLSKSKSH